MIHKPSFRNHAPVLANSSKRPATIEDAQQTKISTPFSILFFLALTTTILQCVSASLVAAPFTPGNLVVYRVGSGYTSVTQASGNAVFLDEYTPAGQLVQSIPMPTEVNGDHRRLVSGNTSIEGGITRSVDTHYLIATGYDANIGTPSLNSSLGLAIFRTIGRIRYDGQVDTTTHLKDFADGGVPTSAASLDGSSFWITGSPFDVRYATFGQTPTSNSVQIVPASSTTLLRDVCRTHIFSNKLYVSDRPKIGTFGTDLPTSPNQIFTPLPGQPDVWDGQGAFFMADLSSTVNGIDTLYHLDNGFFAFGNGVKKFSLVDGTWISNGRKELVAFGGGDVSGLVGIVAGTSVELYATLGKSLVRIVDATGYNETITGTESTTATAPDLGAEFRGIALAPVSPPDLSVELNAPTVATAGTSFDYTLTATNAGETSAANVGLNFSIPVGLTFVSATNTNGFTATHSGGLVQFTNGSIGAKASASLTVAVVASAPGIYGPAFQAAQIDPSGTVRESDEANNWSTQSLQVAVSEPLSAPLILRQPENQTIPSGTSATLTVQASGSPAPSFQWFQRIGPASRLIPNATSAIYVAPPLSVQMRYWVQVTNSQGSANSDTATISVTDSLDANLSSLTISSGTLSPTFSSGTNTYSASISNSTSSIQVGAAASNQFATVEVSINDESYAPILPGSPSGLLNLSIGTNTLRVRVTAQDGTVAIYTVMIARPTGSGLTAGHLMFTSMNADEDGWSMVALGEIPSNSTVFFTDNEWNGSQFNSDESYSQWNSGPSPISPGRVIRFSSTNSPTELAASVGSLARVTVAGNTNWDISESGDAIYAYVADSATSAPTFVSAICNQSFASNTTTGVLTNTGLNIGNGALQTGLNTGSDFAQYNGTRSNQTSFSDFLPLISNFSYWSDSGTGDFSATIPSTTDFSLGSPPPTVNLSLSAATSSEAQATIVTVSALASAPVAGNQSVRVLITGSNVNNQDYSLSNSIIMIPNGATSGSVTFTVIDDLEVEGDEIATLTLLEPSPNIRLGTIAVHELSIEDNDFFIPPSITSQPLAAQAIGTGSTATLRVEASGVPAPNFQWYVGASGDKSNPIIGATTSVFNTQALSLTTSYWVQATNGINPPANSNTAVVTVASPPTFATQPASQTISNGTAATLTVALANPDDSVYQWYRGDSGNTANPIADARSATFTTPILEQTTSYWARATNILGILADSQTAVITVTIPPFITTQPSSQTVGSGGIATLTATAGGFPVPGFQWYRGNSGDTASPVEGATTSSFTTPGLTATTRYWVRVSNSRGSVDSNTAVVNVQPPVLGLNLTPLILAEGESSTGSISISAPLAQDLTVTIGATQSGRLTFPGSLTIPAGQLSVPVSVQAVQNQNFEGRISVTMIASAAGSSAATKTLQILDDDTPAFELALSQNMASENGGTNAIQGTLTFDRSSTISTNVTFTIEPQESIGLPENITIPANTPSFTFPITIFDNNAVDGNRSLAFTANLVVNGEVVVSSLPVNLAITDDEGPSLSIGLDRSLFLEGENPAGNGTVTRNPPSESALTVVLTSASPAQLVVPDSVVIPAGQASATFPIRTIGDGEAQGSRSIGLTASAVDYNPATVSVVVTDVRKPDLTIAVVDPLSGGETDSWIDVRVLITNQGAMDAQGPFAQSILLSTDALLGGDTVLGQANFAGKIEAGTSIEQRLRVKLPRDAGRFWLIAQTDSADALSEILENNNNTIGERPFDIAPGYLSTLVIQPTKVASGSSIPISGTATLTTGRPAAFVLVNIHVMNGPVKRVISALTNSSGRFSAVFTPLQGEGGLFQFGAAHPGVATASVQDTVQVYGLAAEPTSLVLSLAEDANETGSIQIRNLVALPVNGITVSNSGVPVGLVFTASPSSTTIPASGTLSIDYSISSSEPIGRGSFTLTVSTVEGATVDIPINVSVESNVPKLVVAPVKLESGMVRGGQQFVNFTISNSGKATSGSVNVRLPSGASWMRLTTPMPLPPLAPGASVPVTIQLLPPSNLTLGDFEGSLVASDGFGASLMIPFSFRALSDQTGQLKVRAEDEYTYYATGNPYLAGANVRLTSVTTSQVFEPIVTGLDGIADFGQIPEGYYDIEVTAARHAPFKARRLIRGGITNQLAAFLSRQTVTHRWSVVPVYVEDRYNITVDTQFETFVPMPVITIEPKVIDMAEIKTDESVVNFTITNHGLIAAETMRINFPKHPLWAFSPALDYVGILPASSSITVPVVIKRILPTDSEPVSDQQVGSFGRRSSTPSALSGAANQIPCFAEVSVCWSLRCGWIDINYCTTVPVPNLRSDCWGDPPPEGSKCQTCEQPTRTEDPTTTYPYLKESPWPWIPPPPPCDDCPPPNPVVYTPPVDNPDLCERVITDNCDPCARALAVAVCRCVDKFLPSGRFGDWAKCAKKSADCISDLQSIGVSWESLSSCSKSVIPCGKALGNETAQKASDALKLLSPIKKLECIKNIAEEVLLSCVFPQFSGESAPALLSKQALSKTLAANTQLPPSAIILIERGEQLEAQLNHFAYYFGSLKWFDEPQSPGASLDVWLDTFALSIESDSASGEFVSAAEETNLVSLPLPGSITPDEALKFIRRYNRSISYWQAGVFVLADVPAGQSTDFLAYDRLLEVSKAFLNASRSIEEAGFESAEEAYEAAKEDLLNDLANSSSGGVCAKIKLRIEQEAVFARDAFLANLELDNEGDSPLENVKFQIEVTTDDRKPANELFSIQLKSLTGIAAVDGTGMIGENRAAALSWLLIPKEDAAPSSQRTYWVGGSISYSVDGQDVTLPISSAAITVLPSPQLTLKYFHQRNVFSDDPFTTEIEPAKPYALAVMVKNTGAGTAHDFQITSAQPTIRENEKGLLADFRIIATQVGLTPLQPSLTANFGEIGAGNIAIGQWLFTSSVQGLFIDYNASFKHIDDAGGERFSLISGVEIHEMNHQVRALGTLDDGLPDFLVNDIPDDDDLPDTIYLSDGSVAPVSVVKAGQAAGNFTKTLTANMPAGWTYLRIPEPSNGQMQLTRIVRSDGLEIPVDVNAWVTDRTFIGLGQRPIDEFILHLLDHDSTGSYTLTYEALPDLDILAPSSQVAALAVNSPTVFAVNWQGTDDRGIALYDLFVSTDGGPFLPWLERTRETGALFEGEAGRSYAFNSRATDAAGNLEAIRSTADTSTVVTVVNQAPVLELIPDQQVAEGGTFVLDLRGNDPDGRSDLLRFEFVGPVPPGLTLSGQGGQLRWVTGETDGGRIVPVQIRVRDSGIPSQTAPRSFSLRVLEVNSSPVLSPVTPQNAVPGTSFTLQLAGNDTDLPAQSLGFAIASPILPGMTINPSTGLILWQVPEEMAGSTHVVEVLLSDDARPSASSSQTFLLAVDAIDGNAAPVADRSSNRGVVGDLIRGEVTASDSNRDPLVFQAHTQPEHGTLTINPDGTYRFRASPGYEGRDSFTFVANDGSLDSLPASVTLSITAEVPQWTWMAGSDRTNQRSLNGEQGLEEPANLPGARSGALSWTDKSGALWLFGGLGPGVSNSPRALNDLWKRNPGTTFWTWVSGSQAPNAPGIYGVRGEAAPANTPGARSQGVAWLGSDGRLWLFGGIGRDSTTNGSGLLNDLWCFDPATTQWTWMAGAKLVNELGRYGSPVVGTEGNVPGSRRGAVGWSDSAGRLWLFGGSGLSASGNAPGLLNDLWRFDTGTGRWTFVNGGQSPNAAGVYGTLGDGIESRPGARQDAVAWTGQDGTFWMFGGQGRGAAGSGYLNDLWRYYPVSNRWIWVHGSSGVNTLSRHGTLGESSPTSQPGSRAGASSWVDASGALWLIGGQSRAGHWNDVWNYEPSINQWAWIKGPKTVNGAANYGTLGVAAPMNTPGARRGGIAMGDTTGDLWTFGGANGNNTFNDVWRLDLPPIPAVRTLEANGITETTATLRSMIQANGITTEGGFRYWKTNAPDIKTEIKVGRVGDVTQWEPLEWMLTGLVPSTRYTMQAFGASVHGEGIGGWIEFETLGPRDMQSVQFASTELGVGEGDGTVLVSVFLGAPAESAFSVPFEVSGTANAGDKSDYQVEASAVNFVAGQISALLAIKLLDDVAPENEETIVITLGAPTGAIPLGDRNVCTIAISDNDSVPKIIEDPIAQFNSVGTDTFLTVTAIGSSPLSYEWQKNGRIIKGASEASLKISGTPLSSAGNYRVRVSNPAGVSEWSGLAELSVVDPVERTVMFRPNGTSTMRVAASSPSTLSYQWKRQLNDVEDDPPRILGSNANTLVITQLEGSDAGRYVCSITSTNTQLSTEGGVNTLSVVALEPQVLPIEVLPPGVVGGNYAHRILVNPDPLRAPKNFSVSGLPPGLRVSSDGVITGRPTSPHLNKSISIIAQNTLGNSVPELCSLTILPLPLTVPGAYVARVERHKQVNGNLGGRLELAPTSKGSYSSRLMLGELTMRTSGLLAVTVDNDMNPPQVKASGRAVFTRPDKTLLIVDFTLDAPPNTISGTVLDSINGAITSFSGFRNPWSSKGPKASGYTGYYTFGLDVPIPRLGDLSLPQGTGFGAFTVTDSGAMGIAGRLADGATFSTGTFMGPNGEVVVFVPLTSTHGSLVGIPVISGSNAVSTNLTWNRNRAPTESKVRGYRRGFEPVELSMLGGRYEKPKGGEVVMGLPNQDLNARLSFFEGGLLSGQVPPTVFSIRNLTPTGVNQRVTMPRAGAQLNLGRVSFAFATSPHGQFFGRFTVPNSVPVLVRPASYQGMIIQLGSTYHAAGYFLLPQLPQPGQSLKTSPELGGKVFLEPSLP